MEEKKEKKKKKLLVVLLALLLAGGVATTAIVLTRNNNPGGSESQVESQQESRQESRNESSAESGTEESGEESSADVTDMEAIVKAAYELEPGASMEGNQTLTGVITAINTPYDSNYDNITVTIVVGDLTDNPIKCYRLSGEGAKDLAKGDTITVEGILTNYNGTIEFAQGCTVTNIVKGEGGNEDEDLGDTAAILEAAKKLKDGESLDKEYSLTGVITKIAKIYDYEKDGTVTPEANFYMDVNGTEIYCYATKGEHIKEIATSDTVTVKGYIKNYQGTIEFNIGTMTGWVKGTDRQQPTNEPAYKTTAEIVAAAQKLADGEHLDNDNKYTLTGTITKISKIYDYTAKDGTVTPEADFYMEVNGVEFYCYAAKGAQIKNIGKGDAATVNGTIQNYNGTLEIYLGTLTGLVKGTDGGSTKWTTPEEIVNGAYALADGDSTTPDEYTLTGKITKINTAWDAGYGNITVTIAVDGMADKPIQCYRMKPASGVTGVDKLAVGDIITVKGTLSNYKGTIEFNQGCLCTKIEKQLLTCTVTAVSSDETMGTVSVEGYVITVTPAAGYQFKDCTVTAGTASFEVDGNKINVTPTTNCTVTVNFEAKVVSDCPYKVDTAYKFAVNQKNLEGAPTLYLTGAKSGNFFATTRNVDEAKDVFLEAVEGGYRLYFMDGDTKKYIDIYEYQAGKLGIEFNTEPTAVYTYNSDLDIFTATVLDKESYLGIYGTFETISRSDISYITGSNAANCDVTQHPARLVSVTPATTAKVTYMVNGTELKNETVDLDATFTLPTEATAIEGFTFYGWTVLPMEADSTDTPIILTEASVSEDTTFYAVYKTTNEAGADVYSTNPVVAPTYTVTALVNDETFGSATVEGNAITVTPAAGYKFKSCEVTSGTATATYKDGIITVEAASDCTVTVTFEAKQYAVRANGFADGAQVVIAIGGNVPTTATYTKGFTAAVAEIADGKLTLEDNYLVLTAKAAGEGGQYYLVTADGKYVACEATGNKLYLLDAADQYSLWQFVNKGTEEAPVMVVENLNAVYGTGDSAKKQGWEYYGGNFTVYGYKADNTNWTAYQAELYALVDRPLPTTVAITFIANGKTVATDNYTVGETVLLPVPPIYNGYIFAGWTAAEVPAETATAPTFITEATAEADATYYAVYKKSTVGAPAYTLGTLADGAVVVITEKVGDAYYAMTNDNGTAGAPVATLVTVSDGKITGEVPANLLWTVVASEGSYQFKNGANFLYCNDANNGVRVGTGEKNLFTIDATSGYLFNEGYIRYIGVYNKADWRSYTSINDNIKNQTLGFYVQTLGEETAVYTTAPAGFVVTAEVNDETFGTATVDGYVITVTPAVGYKFKDITVAPEDAASYTVDGDKITLVPTADVTVTVNFEACDMLDKVTELHNGDKIIIVVNGYALTTEPATKKGYVGDPISGFNGKLAAQDNYMVLTVVVTAEGLQFTDEAGKYMTSAPTGNGMTFETAPNEYSLWELITKGDYTLVSNKNAKYENTKTGVVSMQALEYYQGAIYPYSYNDSTTDFSIYGAEFYLVEAAEVLPTGTVSITYIANGSTVDTVTVDGGSTFTLPTTAPAAEGYTFAGWTATEITTETTEKPVLVTSAVATADATYYAVYKRTAEGTTGTYTKATSASDLAVGKKAIITAANADQALGTYGSSLFNQTAITKSGDKATLTDIGSANILTLAAGSTSGTWAFKTSDGKYIAITSTKNKAGEVASVNDDASFTVTFGDKTTITASTYTWNLFCYNSSSPRFCFYAASSNQQPVAIYVYKTDTVDYYTTAAGTSPVVPPVVEEYTVTAAVNDSTFGSATADGNVITFAAADGYEYAGYTIAPEGAATAVVDGSTITVTASADCTVTVNFKAVVPPTPEEIVNAAYALAAGAAMDKEYALTGVITAINSAYSSQYGNISVTIVVGDMTDKPIQCFRMKAAEGVTGIADLAVGDTITCIGLLKNYNGTIEFDANCVLTEVTKGEGGGATEELTTPEEIVNAAYALASGTALTKEYTLTGVITKIDTAWNASYKNMTVTFVVGDMTDKPIMAYRMTASDKDDAALCDALANLAVGDTVSVTGTIKNYNGTIEFDSGCIGVYVPTGGGEEEDTPVITAASANEAQGTVALDGNVITATPAEGYRLAGYTVDPADAATVTVDGNALTVTATADCAVTVSFEAIPVVPPVVEDVTATLVVNGVTLTTETFAPGEEFTLPVATAAEGYEFLGWVTTPITEETVLDSHNMPAVYEDNVSIEEDTVFYALFKHEVKGEGTSAYTLVTSADQLVAGKKVVIAAKNADYALSTNQATNNRTGVAITKSGNTLTVNANVCELILKAGNAANTWSFYDGTGYLYAASTSKNWLRTEATLSANSSFTIEISSSATTITATGTNTRNLMQYNPNNGSPIFACYGSAQQPVVLFIYTTTEGESTTYYIAK